MMSYKIIRFSQNGLNRIIETGLTLEEAQAHCRREDTHGPGWFDGYEDEDEDRDFVAEQRVHNALRDGAAAADKLLGP
jgi:hypothetical protein